MKTENNNIPCKKCERSDLPLHIDYKCPNCSDVPERESAQKTTVTYKYGAPDEYGDYPYLYAGQYKKEALNDILKERLPDNYPMQIVDPIEEQVIADCSAAGIDAHLEAMSMTDTGQDRRSKNRNNDRYATSRVRLHTGRHDLFNQAT
jgi:hypothetical protein